MSGNVIGKTFREWTDGLGVEEARISVFNNIRDIPYVIVPQFRDPKVGTSGILELNKGSCQPKHFLLAVLFDKLNIPIKYVSYPFRWVEQPMKFPEDLKNLVNGLPVSYHLACKAFINGKWVLIDATYDLALETAGFPVNKQWDGASDTKNAVTHIEEVIHNNLEERVNYELIQKSNYSEKEKELSGLFVQKFNLWLESIRGK